MNESGMPYHLRVFNFFRCPELNACISAALWCDDVRHCPSGFDEADSNCAFQLGIPLLYVLIGGVSFSILAVFLCITLCIKCQSSRRTDGKVTQNHHVNHIHNNTEAYGLGNNLPISKRFPTSAHDDLYMSHLTMIDAKDSLCRQRMESFETTVWL